VFYTPDPRWRLQLNVENLLDRRYYAFAHNNSNITPGAPTTLRLGLQLKY
jgi:catecholate siderophore receptor